MKLLIYSSIVWLARTSADGAAATGSKFSRLWRTSRDAEVLSPPSQASLSIHDLVEIAKAGPPCEGDVCVRQFFVLFDVACIAKDKIELGA